MFDFGWNDWFQYSYRPSWLVAGNVELADFELGKTDDQEYYILMKIASDDCGSWVCQFWSSIEMRSCNI